MTNQLYDVATNNVAQAADLNQAVDALNMLLGFTNTVTVNGPTSGTATLYQLVAGTFKMVLVSLSNYKNNPAGDQTITLPSAFTHGAHGWNGDSGKFDLKSAGTNITVQVHTGQSDATVDGSVSPQTGLKQNSMWHCGVFDTIGLWGSDTGTHNGYIFMIGS